MGAFGKVKKTKMVTRTIEKEVYVKGWRAKLAERLLSKDIDDLKAFIVERQEEEYYAKIKEEGESLLSKWWKNYQYQLDDEILEIFPNLEPFLSFSEYKGDEIVADLTEDTYKKVRVNGQWLVFIPRFKKKSAPPTNKEGKE